VFLETRVSRRRHRSAWLGAVAPLIPSFDCHIHLNPLLHPSAERPWDREGGRSVLCVIAMTRVDDVAAGSCGLSMLSSNPMTGAPGRQIWLRTACAELGCAGGRYVSAITSISLLDLKVRQREASVRANHWGGGDGRGTWVWILDRTPVLACNRRGNTTQRLSRLPQFPHSRARAQGDGIEKG